MDLHELVRKVDERYNTELVCCIDDDSIWDTGVNLIIELTEIENPNEDVNTLINYVQQNILRKGNG